MNNKTAPRVEGSTEQLEEKLPVRNFTLTGLQDVPRSIIPIPFYKFVQPSTEKAFLPDGKRATNGSFLMPDVRREVEYLRIIILRAKRSTRVQSNEQGIPEKVVSLRLLGINLDRMRPFILGVPVTSFSALGAVFEEMERRECVNAWEYPVYLATEEVNKNKETSRGMENVNYWILDATLEPNRLSEEDMKIAQEAYYDFAPKLDDNEDETDLEAMAGK